VRDLIRPFMDDNDSLMTLDNLQENWSYYNRHESGVKHLSKNTVLGDNGFVNITPTSGIGGVNIKNCMFSIENLAWKDVLKQGVNKDILSPEQKGPLGGRIMWFPPYNLKFTENVSTELNSKSFIGRGEKIYTYTNTDRTGTLSFTILIDHPSVINYWKKGKEYNNNDEQDLLRFFAGCGPLDLQEMLSNAEIDVDSDEIVQINPTVEPNEILPIDGKIVFYVYFPNNYSGIDDMFSKINYNNPVEAMSYLICGKGTQTTTPLISPINLTNGPGYEMSTDQNKGITVDTSDKIDGKWCYRVDDKYRSQVLANTTNYEDHKSFQLNSMLNNNPSDADYPFAAVYAAYYNRPEITNYVVENGTSQGQIDMLLSIFNNPTFVVKNIQIDGSASSHGYVFLNDTLGKDRASSIKAWLLNGGNKSISDKFAMSEWSKPNNSEKPAITDNQSDLIPKLGRSARVEITYTTTNITRLEDTNPYDVPVSSGIIPERNVFMLKTNGGINATVVDGQITEVVRETESRNISEYKRYDNESEFFQLISKDTMLVRDKVMKKIDYFDPAFHSITPEGFNGRLTFLHQCTRQGPTIGGENNGNFAQSAGNLAFGRPPVCILRIGDFYNTRIMIQSFTIDYDPMQWDLNPEGIGVQPMIANINMNFVFLGGSDLGGPIEQLQNAVSFNMYANSSVYDDRALRVEYGDEKNAYDTKGNPFYGAIAEL
jgi:hypothetical protein